MSTLLKSIKSTPETARKTSLVKLQEICMHVGLRKLGSKSDVVERVIRYAMRKSNISDFLREKVYERISSHYDILLTDVQAMSMSEIRNRFYAYRDKKTYTGKDRCKEHLEAIQQEIQNSSIRPYALAEDREYKEYVDEGCGTEPVVFGSLLLHPTKAVSDGNCFFDSVKTCMNIAEDVQTFRKNLAEQFTLDEFLHLSQGWIALGLISDYVENPDTIHSPEDLKKAIQSLEENKRKKVLEVLRKEQKQCQAKIAKNGEWAEEWMTAFVSKVLQMNIIVFENAARQFQMFRERLPMKPFIFLYNFSQTHFTPMENNDGSRIFSEETIREGLHLHKL